MSSDKSDLKLIQKELKNDIEEIKHDELQPHQHPSEGTIQEEIRPAAYARLLAVLPKYANKALEAARPLAYASEVGESFRKMYPWLVKPLYGLSIGYVVTDITIKYISAFNKNKDYKKFFLLDLTLWHLGASLLLPALVINRWVHTLAYSLNKLKANVKIIKYVPTLTALMLIPFIVHPLDHWTDTIMDYSFRKYVNYKDYDDKIEVKKELVENLEVLEEKIEKKIELKEEEKLNKKI